jgi:hypothetical protein
MAAFGVSGDEPSDSVIRVLLRFNSFSFRLFLFIVSV